MNLRRRLITGLILLALLSPVGILLPAQFDAGDAWGEWSAKTIGRLTGFIPEGLRSNADVWKAPIPDYNMGDENSSLTVQYVSYIVSGVIGILLTVLVSYLLARFIVKREN